VNRGALAETWVENVCRRYRADGRALVTIVGQRWVGVRPVRGKPGLYTGRQKRGPVDFIGHDAQGRGFRFDCKASKERVSVALDDDHVPEHQKGELAWCAEHGTPAGLLVCRFHELGHPLAWYWLPAAYLVDREWKRVKWKEADELGLRVPCFDTTRRAPDFLDMILGP
jgi:hypothetical protein